jgi:hypothetical protein
LIKVISLCKQIVTPLLTTQKQNRPDESGRELLEKSTYPEPIRVSMNGWRRTAARSMAHVIQFLQQGYLIIKFINE